MVVQQITFSCEITTFIPCSFLVPFPVPLHVLVQEGQSGRFWGDAATFLPLVKLLGELSVDALGKNCHVREELALDRCVSNSSCYI